MKCLLCDCQLNLSIAFTDILCLKVYQESLCRNCYGTFEKISDQHCPRCYKSGIITICNDCQEWDKKGKVINHVSLYKYNDAMKEYFSRYKFQGDYLLRTVFEKEVKQVLKNYKDYTFVPIPLGHKRFEERKFNQVTGLLEAAKIPYQDLLMKKDSEKQSSKTRELRLATTNDFYLKEHVTLPLKVMLVDDIYTTGATLKNAKECFTEKGVNKIKTFSLAR